MSTNLDIVNSALLKLGQEKVTSYPDTTTARGITVSEQFPKILKRLLRGHPWNFAMKRTKVSVATATLDISDISIADNTFSETAHGYLTGQKVQLTSLSKPLAPLAVATDYYIIKVSVDLFKLATSLANAIAGTAINITGTNSAITIPFSDVSTATDKFTYVAHGLITGQQVTLTPSTTGTTPTFLLDLGSYYIINTAANDFQLASTYDNAIALVALDIQTQGTLSHVITPVDTLTIVAQDKNPEFQFDYQATLPSDYVRAFKVTSDQDGRNNVDHEIENGKILCNYESFYLAYTSLVTDPSLFPDDFSECFALLLASECAYAVVQNKELKIALMGEFKEALGDTRFNDGFETTNEPMQVDYFINTRY